MSSKAIPNRPAYTNEPAFALLAACCTYGGADSSFEERLQTALQQPVDSERFRQLARRHGVQVLVHKALASLTELDDRLRAQLTAREDVQRIQMRALLLHAELKKLDALLSQHGIAYVPLKGTSLSARLYGDACLRQMKDIDVLVPPHQLAAAIAALEQAGYQVELPAALRSEQQLHLVRKVFWHLQCHHPQKRIQLELHWRFERRAQSDCEARWWQWLAARGTRAEAYYELLYLCLHGSGHGWVRLKWLTDVAIYQRRFDADDWRALLQLTSQLKMERILAQSLLLAQQVLGVELPAAAAAHCKHHGTEARASVMDAHRWIDDAKDSMSSGHARRTLLALRLMFTMNHRYSVRENLCYWGFFLGFHEEDILNLQLPRWRYWQYPLLRPLRLLGRWLSKRRAAH